MSLGSKHYNYLFIGKKYCDLTLLNDKVFPLIMDEVNPLLSYTNRKKCRVYVLQYDNEKVVKCGRPRWTKESILPICRNVNHSADKSKFSFIFIDAEFPSIESAYNKGNTVDIFLRVENSFEFGDMVPQYDCGLFLSLREDIFEAAGEALVKRVLENIFRIFDSAKVLFHKRSWWSHATNEESGLQDVRASFATNEMYSYKYANWVEMDLCKKPLALPFYPINDSK